MPSIPQPLDPNDDGSAAPAVAAALAAYEAGTCGPTEVLAALSAARLLVPVVAMLTESEVGAHGLRQEKESEMALPKLVGQDGRHAVLAFTSSDALARWRKDARPIQTGTLQVCRAAVHEEAAAVVVDVAGPVQFVIEGEVLRALAAVESGTLDQLKDVTVARIGPAGTDPGKAAVRPRRRWFSRKGS